MNSSNFRNRVNRVLQALRKQRPAALLIGNAPTQPRNRDTNYPYRQSSDLYYLTGATDGEFLLFLSTEGEGISIFSKPVDPKKIIWEGESTNLRRLSRSLGGKLVISDSPYKEVRKRLIGIETLFTSGTPGAVTAPLAQELLALPGHARKNLPATISHPDLILAPLRLIKDPFEIQQIKTAAAITNEALFSAIPFIRPGISESHIAAVIQLCFQGSDATCSFPPIVATGQNAATLHYHALRSKLKAGDLLLLDVGAEYQMYAGDITRVVPVSGKFSDVQRRLYAVVLAGQRKGIAAVKPGTTVAKVYDAAAREMADGLKDLGIAKGTAQSIIKKGLLRKFFPHGIGHPLGLDVHDITALFDRYAPKLAPGMVMTIEPGLYFPKALKGIAPCGIRIEDDVLVTNSGRKILSDGFPKDPDQIEGLFNC